MRDFFERYDHKIIPEPNTGCLIWLGAIGGSGYGHIGRDGKYIDVHRAVFLCVHGWLPDVVRHSCDLKLCVNDAHLLPGTNQDNMDDAVARGLMHYGERSGASKLTAIQAKEIREYTGALSQAALGKHALTG